MSAKYLLMTGATGLLGQSLLSELLPTRPGALLVRAGAGQNATARVERILANTGATAMADVIVLAADLRRPDLGLSEADRAWVREHCGAVLHSAASLTFTTPNPAGNTGPAPSAAEPYRTNLTGTRNLLELCRDTGIGEFHLVSTAYSCGLTPGPVPEAINFAAPPGNDYELSKRLSELLVQNAPFLHSRTVYRPSIIVGDSRTGASTTYHGFYIALRLVCELLWRTGRMPPQPLHIQAKMNPTDGKNIVPVDWVAGVIASILGRPDRHGSVYHLTHPHPHAVADLERIWVAAASEVAPRVSGTVGEVPTELEGDRALEVYRSYFRHDPVFDRTNTMAALPDLPCPPLTEADLLRMCRVAIADRFGLPAEFVPEWFPRPSDARRQPPTEELMPLRLESTGQGVEIWTFAPAWLAADHHGDASQFPVATAFARAGLWHDLLAGTTTLDSALAAGMLSLETSHIPADQVIERLAALLMQRV